MHYYQYGTGRQAVLCFHGFGQDGTVFKKLAQKHPENRYYSFDLFFHGKSYWTKHDVLTKKEWKEIINSFLKKERLETFALIGFSMGGKMSLATLEHFPDRISHITLIAPDGIKTSTFYSLATYPVFFKNYFQSMIVKPQRFHAILNGLKKVGIVDRSILKFAHSQMNTRKNRRRVYYSWITFKPFQFALEQIANVLNENEIPLIMALGKYDKIITLEGMNRLLKYVDQKDVILLDCGHNNLIEHFAQK